MVTSSGDGLVRPVNAPGSAPLAYGTQPGVTSPVLRAVIVLVGGTGVSGVFVYDPSIGAGNLIASMTDAAADPFGDVTTKGVTAYVTDVNSLREAVNLNESSVSGNAGLGINDTAHPAHAAPGAYGQGSGTGGLSRAVAFLDSGLVTNVDVDAIVSAQSQVHSGITNGLAELLAGQVNLGNTPTMTVNDNTGAVTATLGSVSTPSLITTDTWHSASLVNSWAGSGSATNGLWYRLETDNTVKIIGDLTSPGTASVITTLPAGYRPAQSVNIEWNRYDDSGTAHATVGTGGAVTMQTTVGAGKGLFCNAFIPLDSL